MENIQVLQVGLFGCCQLKHGLDPPPIRHRRHEGLQGLAFRRPESLLSGDSYLGADLLPFSLLAAQLSEDATGRHVLALRPPQTGTSNGSRPLWPQKIRDSSSAYTSWTG
jgi:hypothetical protein